MSFLNVGNRREKKALGALLLHFGSVARDMQAVPQIEDYEQE
jgi:hypothetical protein